MRPQCYCNAGYRGSRCQHCDFGHHRVDSYCVPCDCSNNHRTDVQDFCDELTGTILGVNSRLARCHYGELFVVDIRKLMGPLSRFIDLSCSFSTNFLMPVTELFRSVCDRECRSGRRVNVGQCKACAYHTSGAHCDVCYPGYDGNALDRSCSQ